MKSIFKKCLLMLALTATTAHTLSIPSIENATSFDQNLQQHTYVVIDFWMPSCGPCKQLAPKLDAIAQRLSNVQFFKVDITKVESIARRFSVRSVPKLIFFKNGVEVGSHLGNTLSETELQQKIKNAFGL